MSCGTSTRTSALLSAAYSSIPTFAYRPSDLPSQSGFAVFAEPIVIYSAEEVRRDDVIEMLVEHGDDEETRRVSSSRMYSDTARIVAVS